MYKLLLCNRYLRTRYIALASIISVMLGVATMIVVNSVMSGFSSQMRGRIHAILADMVLEVNGTDGAPNADEDMAKIRDAAGEFIAAMSPTVEIYGMLSFPYIGEYITRPVTLLGIEPASKAEVGELKQHLVSYAPVMEDKQVVKPAARPMTEPPSWELLKEDMDYRRLLATQQQYNNIHNPPVDEEDDNPGEDADAEMNDAAEHPFEQNLFPAPELTLEETIEENAAPRIGRAYVGVGLISYQHDRHGKQRTEMMIRPGADIKLSTVSAGRPPDAKHFNATVVDVFKSGMSEYDSNLVFMNIEYLRAQRGMVGEKPYTTIQIRLKNYADADKVVDRLRAAFSPRFYSVRTWEQKQGPLLAAVAVESAILNVLLFLIIAVAGFGILAIFFMIVVEKTRDIGILKALGAGSGGVLMIFMSYGLALGIVGSGVGVILGLLFVRYINPIEAMITRLTGHKVFDERIYYFPEIPTDIQPMMVLWVALGAMAIAVLASILPARRAAQLHPVEALRYE